MKALDLPGQSVVVELYLEGGIRGVEVGTVMFGRVDPETGDAIPAAMELVRLAMPRRVYTQSHVDYMVEAIVAVFRRREGIGGFRFTYQAPALRHFTAQFEPLYRVGGETPSDVETLGRGLPTGFHTGSDEGSSQRNSPFVLWLSELSDDPSGRSRGFLLAPANVPDRQ